MGAAAGMPKEITVSSDPKDPKARAIRRLAGTAPAPHLAAKGRPAGLPLRELSVRGEYKVAAEEYKAYLLTLESKPKSLTPSLRETCGAARAGRRLALPRIRDTPSQRTVRLVTVQPALGQTREDPFERRVRLVALQPTSGVETLES